MYHTIFSNKFISKNSFCSTLSLIFNHLLLFYSFQIVESLNFNHPLLDLFLLSSFAFIFLKKLTQTIANDTGTPILVIFICRL